MRGGLTRGLGTARWAWQYWHAGACALATRQCARRTVTTRVSVQHLGYPRYPQGARKLAAVAALFDARAAPPVFLGSPYSLFCLWTALQDVLPAWQRKQRACAAEGT